MIDNQSQTVKSILHLNKPIWKTKKKELGDTTNIHGHDLIQKRILQLNQNARHINKLFITFSSFFLNMHIQITNTQTSMKYARRALKAYFSLMNMEHS